MIYILYKKKISQTSISQIYPYIWILDNLTNRRYIRFNYFYISIYIYKIIIKNINYLVSYQFVKKIIKLESIVKFLTHFNYIKKTIKLYGVGYKINLIKNTKILSISLGYSHKIYLKFPESMFYTIQEDNSCIILSSYNQILLTTIISKLKKLHKYDPYKGKGFQLVGEIFTPKFYKK